jgi:DNA invertase Pin-like site-specific DNA recombinase
MHELTIVCTYRDEGESGLKIKNRMGLTQLIEDIRSGHTDFSHVLVYDVSRWGRFQDIDESAHYEFTCRQSGIKVAYCAEEFDNDGSLISNIVKNIKRVMAAEYSRELSAKTHAGACRLAKLGFKMGGRPGHGLERLAVDQNNQPRGILKDGEHKYLGTDRVRVRPSSPDEVAVVGWIFKQFVAGRFESQIARELNLQGVPTNNGRPWNRARIGYLLRNETYMGNLVYNKSSQRLGTKVVRNSPDLWVRHEGCVEPIIDQDTFTRARAIREARRVNISEEEMLVRLRRVLLKVGKLRASIINKTIGLPSADTYLRHFGSLRNVYRLIGYTADIWTRKGVGSIGAPNTLRCFTANLIRRVIRSRLMSPSNA